MISNLVFAVFDSKGKYFKSPFMMRSKGEAIRAFSDIANDKEHEICKHASDFTLFHLGSFDFETGKYTNEITPVSLGVAIEFKEVVEQPKNRIVNIEEVKK